VTPVVAGFVLTLLAQAPASSGGKKLSPGAVAMLVTRTDADSKATVRRALSDPDSAVRAIAARVVSNAPYPELLNDLFAALARERDQRTAAEMIRGLLAMGGAGVVQVLEPQVRRNGPPAVLAYAEGLARGLPEQFVEKLPDLHTLVPDTHDWIAIVRMAAEQHPGIRPRVLDAWMKSCNKGQWISLLDALYAPALSAGHRDQAIVDALGSDRPDVRSETVWFVIDQMAAGSTIPDVISTAALPLSDREPSSWEEFGREIVARSRKHGRATNRSDFLLREATAHRTDVTALRMLSVLLPEERETLQGLFGDPGKRSDSWGAVTATLPSPVVPGVLASILKAADCANTTQGLAIASVEYSAVGRPARIELRPVGLSSTCLEALTTTARLTVADTDRATADGPLLLVLPLKSDVVSCVDQFVPTPDRVLDDAAALRITAPRKTREVKPEYPRMAQTNRIQGVVYIDATVSATGCIARARVIRGVPGLDAAALQAISQWQFTPATLDGEAIAVSVTTTANFVLQ